MPPCMCDEKNSQWLLPLAECKMHSDFFRPRLFFPSVELNVNEIEQCVVFCIWLLWSHITFWSFINIVIYNRSSFYFTSSITSVCLVTQSCLTVCDPMDCSPPGSSVQGVLQARILEWVVMPSSKGSSQPGNQTQIFHIAGGFFTVWATREALYN